MDYEYKYYGNDVETIMEIWDDIVKVEWANIGEGNFGDYDPDDPDDENLLRFYGYVKTPDGEWEELEDASYCTNVSADTPENVLKEKLEVIFKEYRNVIDKYPPEYSVKKTGECLSWI